MHHCRYRDVPQAQATCSTWTWSLCIQGVGRHRRCYRMWGSPIHHCRCRDVLLAAGHVRHIEPVCPFEELTANNDATVCGGAHCTTADAETCRQPQAMRSTLDMSVCELDELAADDDATACGGVQRTTADAETCYELQAM